MPRGHSKYLDDPYGAFVEDVRLAIVRAESHNGGMNEDEYRIVQAVAAVLYVHDPASRAINPPRSFRATNVKG